MASIVSKARDYMAEKIANMEKPQASLTGLYLESFNCGGVNFISKIEISNPYHHSIPICEISYSLKSDGRLIASGTIPDPGSIKADTETKVDVPVKAPHDFLISLVKDIGRDWDIDYELEVGLTIDLPVIGDFIIPLKMSGEIKLPTLLDLF